MAKKVKVALVYDFDDTLSTAYMQDYALIPAFGMKPETFWKNANKWATDNEADQITGTMYYVQKTAKEKGIQLTKEYFRKLGENIEYYAGVQDWFQRINKYGKWLGLTIEHFIISAGYNEILEGTEIRKYFKDVFACSYAFDKDGLPLWPARVVNYSIKAQCLSKINKGLKQTEDRAVNEFTPDDQRPIPYKRMIYFGDGYTDIPPMKITKDRGGHAIAVYKPKSKNKSNAIKLLKDERVNFALPADYREGKEIDHVVKTILLKIATEQNLELLKSKEEKKKKTKR
ncbi:MAG: haloacid dehalogenase-like hydrolase [Lactobacillaceae bacterium]|jgi:2-hydroxy-3-keto-5-methylthiopentenyl-1-phosphate phosphatase|nr:haloacid dehalogenase-like hydrolase [Lactobacillaceae bacterium]